MAKILGLLALAGWAFCLCGQEAEFTVHFDRADLSLSKVTRMGRVYDLVSLLGSNHIRDIGKPWLPQQTSHAVLPPTAAQVRVELVTVERERLPGSYSILPAQPPTPLVSGTEIPFVEPDPVAYSVSSPYPQGAVTVSMGYMGGYVVAGLLIHPVQYVPSDGTLYFCSTIGFRLVWTEGRKSVKLHTELQKQSFGGHLRNTVLNPEDVDRYSPPVMPSKDEEECDYLIITSPALTSSFQPLADWKTRKGLRSRTVTTDRIYANHSGVDGPDVIRNFIRYAVDNWGVTWVLLGGDTDLLPCRMVYLFSAGFEPSHDTVLCDLYYSDLDSTWDADEDGAYGEVEDAVDMYPDVWIGRASVNTVQECNTFVSKTLTYERNPPLYHTKELLLSSWVFGDNWGEYGNDTIAAKTPNHHTVSKLYHSQGDLNASAVLDSIEAGYHFIHQTAHCGVDCATTGPNFVYNWNLDALTNGDFLPIYLIAGCLAGSFHRDCYAEHWVNNPDGGGVAACMNSGVAYAGDLGELAYSEGLNVAFFDRLFTYGNHQIGLTLGVAKALTVPEAQVDLVYRLCTYELNLLGDPELPMWTDEPDTLVVTHDSAIESGDTTAFTIAVTDNDGSSPIDSAYVCCTCKFDSAFCHTGHTDANGNITFHLAPGVDSDTMFVTVTKRNYLPAENRVIIFTSEEQEFIRGDANADLVQTVADAIYIVSHVYREGPCECQDCCDVNDDGRITVGDAIYIAGHIYRSGLPPAQPFPGCGMDLTPDELECVIYPCATAE